ncbi:MAG: hypothetical protein FJZ01_11740 [Candidatus Sericytochromatia bacterium]|nr:hypothetical protein [Candidatus Tanganyikabacteria bacterium]
MEARVEFIVIGGFAATLLGTARFTADLDVVYRRTEDNLARLVAALAPFEPYLRGAPPGLPFRFDVATLRHGLNFTLSTTAGLLDLLGEATGEGVFEKLLPDSEIEAVFGLEVRRVTLDRLIELKRAAGRVKDLEPIAELEALREEKLRASLGP